MTGRADDQRLNELMTGDGRRGASDPSKGQGLSALLQTVETADKQIALGIIEINGADVVALVRRFRRSKKAEWEWIARPVDGVPVTAPDLIIMRREFERCERAWGLFDAGAAEGDAKAAS